MRFADQITRTPRPFDTDRADDIRQAYAGQPAQVTELLVGTGGSSPFLHGLLLREREWLLPALEQGPAHAFDRILAGLTPDAPNQLKTDLRVAKRKVALLTALADLGGVWSLEEVTGRLTAFADRATELAAQSLVSVQIDRGKLPGQGEDDKPTCAGLVILAMGKMGAQELNYSSDIDLISLFDESRYDPSDYGDVRTIFVKVTRALAGMLNNITADGYVFRTDLRLRPDPSVTPVCLSMEAAERYYESVGRTWERAAHIKARACAGDVAAGEAYLRRLTPFVWRKHLDFAAIQDAHDMRLRIRDHKGLRQKIALEGHNIKLGPGSIREIEFFTQTRQIIAGGRDPSLRSRQTVPALAALAKKGWVDAAAAETLTESYRYFREVEHRLQMVNDAQTQDLPNTPEGMDRIAALCGVPVARFRDALMSRLVEVDEITEGFFAPSDAVQPVVELSAPSRETVDRWKSYPALRSSRSVEIFERLKPELLKRMQGAAHPDEAILHFDQFLAGLPAGVQVFSLFEANPPLIDLIVDIASTAPHLASYLGRNASVFDAVIGGDFFAQWPGMEELRTRLDEVLAGVDDYEAKLSATRRWQKEWHFRVGVHQLRALIDADEAGAQYADLAEACLQALWPVVAAEFSRKYGAPPGNGGVVLGMGSLGSRRLTAASDLDMIAIYDADGAEYSDGPRQLPTRVYYARLTQALVTALSAQMPEGRLYEVDMRLRPSGRKGPVATSIESFESYQTHDAWTWEHLALTRARVVAGKTKLGDRVETFRRALLAGPHDVNKIVADVAEMRERIASAKPAKSAIEAKLGYGRMQDVELLAQTAALLSGKPGRRISVQLVAARQSGWIDQSELDALLVSYRMMWQMQSAARLLTGDLLDLAVLGEGGRKFLLRETGTENTDQLVARLEEVSQQAGAVIDKALGTPPVLA